MINEAAKREKSIRHGHPSTLHLWWSRKPLAACRAILFASLVDDPSEHKDRFSSEKAQEKERKRLFGIIEDLVQWENTQNRDVLAKARDEIRKSQNTPIPPIRDPFCGGGSIPLEAQRLGLQARSSDLKPVAVLITKALIAIPPIFAGCPPVAPDQPQHLISSDKECARGLAHDIRSYGQWIRDEAERRMGHLYPKVPLPAEYGGGEATVIAWLWVRTVTCPNPACSTRMPLTSKWWLSKKEGRRVWVEPVVDRSVHPASIHFLVKQGRKGTPQEGTVNRKGATCIVCNTSVPFPYIRSEGKAKRMGTQLLAIVAEGTQGRLW
ncbi:MAG TPA: DUF1156 domain-containing protein [Ktedonobacteraceae bacterium]|nr:DUF1156 domain-containing protein [Ktedonobacteraceae bacterium]